MIRLRKNRIFFLGMFAMFMISISSPASVIGQQDSKKTEKKPKAARIQLDYYNDNNQEYTIKATVKTKVGRSYVTVSGVPVIFSMTSNDGEFETELGEVVSDGAGVAEAKGKVSELSPYRATTFKAAIKASDDFKKYSKKLEVQNAEMAVEYVTEDSINQVKVRCSIADSTGEKIPIEDLDVKVFVERLFGELPVAADFNSTDENGEVDILFPENVSGDTNGQLVVVVRIEDHEDYGNLVNTKAITWGTPLIEKSNGGERQLWAGQYKAPIPLVILINGVLIVVWGLIFYIVINVVRIFRIGKAAKSTM